MGQNLRSFLDGLGDRLLRIREPVDPINQVGILCSESKRPLLFENLKGFPDWRFTDMLVMDRYGQAAALGLSDIRQVAPVLAERMARGPGKSRLVSDGPCKEVKLIGEAADIRRVPIPIHSVGDAGRYLGSGLTITKDPDTGLRNVAIIRTQLHDDEPRKCGFWMAARHNWAHYLKYQERNQPMPMAYAIGLHPAYEIMANWSGRHEDFDELEYAAGIVDETVEMVKCETIDLEVPAEAEVIIEGYVPPHVREMEGPFGEFTGYHTGAEGPAPVFIVTAITHRKQPIFRHMQATRFTDHQPVTSLPMEATYYNRLRETHGNTAIHDVYVPPWAALFTMIIQMTARWDGQAKAVLLSAISGPNLHPKVVIAVDEDVDIYNNEDVIWAISTRVDPATNVTVLPGQRIHPLDISCPTVSNEVTVMRMGGKVLIDATKPGLWRPKEREHFRKVDPAGTGDASLEGLLKLVRQPYRSQ